MRARDSRHELLVNACFDGLAALTGSSLVPTAKALLCPGAIATKNRGRRASRRRAFCSEFDRRGTRRSSNGAPAGRDAVLDEQREIQELRVGVAEVDVAPTASVRTFTDLADYLDDEDVWACAPTRCISRRTRLLHASSIAPKTTTPVPSAAPSQRSTPRSNE